MAETSAPTPDALPLAGRVAVVAGATRGAGRGIAIALGEAGATVYCTGRTTRERRSDYDRPETIEETAEMVDAAGGTGVAVAMDHLDPEQVAALAARVDRERGRLDVLVNDIAGEHLAEWDLPIWEQDLERGLRYLTTAVHTHLIAAHHLLPLMIREPGGLVVEVTDGTTEYNSTHYRISAFIDLAKACANRLGYSLGTELEPHGGTAVALTPGWMRSELMLDTFGVTEENWEEVTRANLGTEELPPDDFLVSETPLFVGRGVAALAADPDRARWNRCSIEAFDLAEAYGFTDVDGSRPDAWGYIVEVREAGKPVDVTGYR